MVDLSRYISEPIGPTQYEPLPEGQYTAAIINSQMRQAKSGNGSYVEITLQILEGPYKGRRLWDRFCVSHSSTQVVQLARERLSAVCHAAGIMQPKDSNELHQIPLLITVKQRIRPDGQKGNNIVAYQKINHPAIKTEENGPFLPEQGLLWK